MNVHDLIFWYTGATVWFIIAIAVAIITALTIGWSIFCVRKSVREWNALWSLCHMTEAERVDVATALRFNISSEARAKLVEWITCYRKGLCKHVHGPLAFKTVPSLGDIFELTTGEQIRCVSTGGYATDDRTFTFQARLVNDTEADWLTILANGRVQGHPMWRVVRRVEAAMKEVNR